MQATPVALVVASVSFAGSGVALLLRRRAQLSGALLALGGAAGVAAALVLATNRDEMGAYLVALCAGLLLPAALICFPSLQWRRPVDSLALTAIVGCGLVAVLWNSVEARATMGLVEGCVLFAFFWWRLEVSHDRERRAVVWVVLALGATGLAYGLVSFSSEGSSTVPGLALTVFALVGPAMYVGATLPDLVDVRGLVVSVAVFFVAVITVLSLYVLAVNLLTATGSGDLSIGAAGLVAALLAAAFHPTQVLLRGVIDQLLFGERPDPLGAASAVADRIGSDPVVALRAIREALVIPYAALLVDGVPLTSSGSETTHTRTLDLDGAGELVVGLRPGDLSFSAGDEQVLRLTVPLLAQTLRARALAEDLIESRGQTIAAVEEERRRLRRELHDGLGPRLSGVAFTSDAARNLIRTDPDAAEQMVTQLRADTVTAIEEIRRMVYAMRPPALDELGLVPALRQQAVGLRNRDGHPVSVKVSAPEAFPDLPAAVEVAAYRIVTEALTNVARHSTSASASVRLDPAEDGLHLEVTDRGSSGPWRPGVGLASMRERAAELGGTLEAGPGPAGGRVAALLPM
jgi:two-component system, NarL family, sensor kinase